MTIGDAPCVLCGARNAAGSERCAGCGAVLTDDERADRPTAGAPAATAADDPGAALAELRARVVERARAPLTAKPRYAGFAQRAVAFLIDGAVLGLFALPLAVAGAAGVRAGLAALGTPAPVESEAALRSLLTGAWFTMAVIYFAALHRGDGQTIGKAVLRIRVRSTALAGIGTGRSLVRVAGYLLSSSFFGLGFLLVAVTPRKRGWHDYLAGTCVVRLAADEG